ncbi:MAG: FtsX-like permease family protein [Acidobacteriota bacterium]
MIKLMWRNLLRNRLRTALTVASVAVALFVLTFLGSLVAALESAEGASESRIVVRHAVSLTFDIPEAYGRRLARLENVRQVTPLDWFGGIYKDQRPENFFPRFGSDPDTFFEVFDETVISEEHLAAWKRDRTGCIAGKTLVEKQGWKLGERIVVQGDIYPVNLELTLRGIYERQDALSQERQLFFHRTYLEESLGNPGRVGTWWLRLDGPEHVTSVVREAEAMYESSAAPVRAETEEAFSLSFLELLGNVRLLLGSVGLAIVVSILFVTANTMAMAARDRTREVAVLRTLGFRRGQVTSLVLGEALLVGILGAVLGAGAASLLLGGLGRAMEDVFPLFATLQPPPTVLVASLAIGLVVGLVSGVVPAIMAARLAIVDGLRKVT